VIGSVEFLHARHIVDLPQRGFTPGSVGSAAWVWLGFGMEFIFFRYVRFGWTVVVAALASCRRLQQKSNSCFNTHRRSRFARYIGEKHKRNEPQSQLNGLGVSSDGADARQCGSALPRASHARHRTYVDFERSPAYVNSVSATG